MEFLIFSILLNILLWCMNTKILNCYPHSFNLSHLLTFYEIKKLIGLRTNCFDKYKLYTIG